MQLLLTAAQDRALKENRVETGRPAGHVVRALVQMWMDDTAGTRARVERVLQEERRQADRWD